MKTATPANAEVRRLNQIVSDLCDQARQAMDRDDQPEMDSLEKQLKQACQKLARARGKLVT